MNSHASDDLDASAPRTSAEALLNSMERVRALAGHVVRQAADQDDLVQEAVLRALAKPSTLIGESGPWVRRVVRNLNIDRQRASARRQDRELDAGDRETSQESTLDSVARAECQRDLVNSVLKLPEPYRAVILCRFFDGLPPREIAKKLGTPVATVKKQQERGMALLRKELEGRYGKDGAWAVALLPILPKSALRALGAKGVGSGTLVLAPRWLALGIAALAGIAVPIFLTSDSWSVEPNVVLSIEEPLDPVAELDESPANDESTASPERSALASPGADEAPMTPAGRTVLRTFTGRFVDVSGAPVAGITATWRGGQDGSGDAGSPGRGSGDGVVFASLDAPLEAAMIVEVEANGLAPAVYRFRPGSTEALVDVGRQTLFPAVDLEVGVVDGEGIALFGWEFSYFHYGGGKRLERARRSPDPITGRSTFGSIAATEVEVIAQHPSGLEIRRPSRQLRVGEVNSMDLVYLGTDPARRVGVALEWPAVAGPQGSAAAGGAVEITLRSKDQSAATVAVDLGAKRAAFEGVEPGYYSLRVEDPRFEAEEVSVEPGTFAKLVLRGNAQLALTLRKPDGRTPEEQTLDDCTVEVLLAAGPPHLLRREAPDVPFEGLVPGQPFVLRVTAPDGRQAVREVRALAPRETRVLDLTLGEGVTDVRVQVVRGKLAAPVAGAEVALFDGALVAGSEQGLMAAAHMRDVVPVEAGAGGAPKRLARGVTDSAGTALLQVPTHEMGAKVTAMAMAGDRVMAPVSQGGARLVLSELGTVRVRAVGLPRELTREGGLPEGVALTLTWPGSVADRSTPFGPGLRLERDVDGSFVTALAPVGPATIWLSLSDFNHTRRGTPLGGVTGPVGYPVGSARVQAGVETEVAVDLDEFWPGYVEVVVRHAGQVMADAVVELEPVGSHGHLPYPFGAKVNVSRILTQLTDGAGRAVFPRVPKGRWKVRVRDIEWLWVAPGGEVDVTAGEREVARAEVELAEGVVTVVDEVTGEPLRAGIVEIEMSSRGRVRRTTNAEGALRLRLGSGSYPLSSLAGDGTAALTGTLDWDVDGPVRPVVKLRR